MSPLQHPFDDNIEQARHTYMKEAIWRAFNEACETGIKSYMRCIGDDAYATGSIKHPADEYGEHSIHIDAGALPMMRELLDELRSLNPEWQIDIVDDNYYIDDDDGRAHDVYSIDEKYIEGEDSAGVITMHVLVRRL